MSAFALPGANAFLNGTALPGTLYVQGHVGNPGQNGTSNVAAETRRIAIDAWDTATLGTKGNTQNEEILNAAATEGWTHVSYWSASSGGTCWFIDALASTLNIEAANTIQIAIGQATLTCTLWS